MPMKCLPSFWDIFQCSHLVVSLFRGRPHSLAKKGLELTLQPRVVFMFNLLIQKLRCKDYSHVSLCTSSLTNTCFHIECQSFSYIRHLAEKAFHELQLFFLIKECTEKSKFLNSEKIKDRWEGR